MVSILILPPELWYKIVEYDRSSCKNLICVSQYMMKMMKKYNNTYKNKCIRYIERNLKNYIYVMKVLKCITPECASCEESRYMFMVCGYDDHSYTCFKCCKIFCTDHVKQTSKCMGKEWLCYNCLTDKKTLRYCDDCKTNQKLNECKCRHRCPCGKILCKTNIGLLETYICNICNLNFCNNCIDYLLYKKETNLICIGCTLSNIDKLCKSETIELNNSLFKDIFDVEVQVKETKNEKIIPNYDLLDDMLNNYNKNKVSIVSDIECNVCYSYTVVQINNVKRCTECGNLR